MEKPFPDRFPARNEHYLAEFSRFISAEYGIKISSIIPAQRGYYGETWKLDSGGGAYFAKVVYQQAQKPKYRRSFAVIERFTASGIDDIPPILKTVNSSLYAEFDGAVVGLFKWLDGENIQNETAKIAEYGILAKVYTVSACGLDIPLNTLDTHAADNLLRNIERIENTETRDFFNAQSAAIEHYSDRLALFAERIARLNFPRYITHGDAGGNIMAGADGRYYLVDWDNPILAPPERDAWFCLHWDWATNAFNRSLRENGIDYALNRDILAFYCYHFWFNYLNFYLETYFENGSPKILQEIDEYLVGWITDNMEYAEGIN
jgi:hypothetical protein